jgi:hypothetical protein
MSDCTPADIAAYETVRQRLRALVDAHPWVREVSIAVRGRMCKRCARKRIVEHPADHFRCTACLHTWEVAPLPSRVSHREHL